MKITESDKKLALQALGLLGSLKLESRELDFKESILEKERVQKELDKAHEMDKIKIQHNLALQRNAIDRNNKLKDELKNIGIPYSMVESDNSKKILEDQGDIIVNDIKKLSNTIEMINAENASLSNKISSYQRGKTLAPYMDVDETPGVSKAEMEQYIKDNPELANTLDSDILEAGIKAGGAMTRLEREQLRTIIANRKRGDLDLRISELDTASKIDKNNRIPLTALTFKDESGNFIDKEYIESAAGYAGNLNRQIFNEYSTADNTELAEWADEGFQGSDERTRFDSDVGMYTHKDSKYLEMYMKRKAKDLAVEEQYNEALIGLKPLDIENETEAYKRFEDKYIKTAKKAIAVNPNYTIKDDASRTVYEATINKAVYDDPTVIAKTNSLKSVGKTVQDLLGTKEDDLIVPNEDMIEVIASNLKTKYKKSIPEKKLKALISQILTYTNEPNVMKNMLLENKDFQSILASSGDLGSQYVRMIIEYNAEIESRGGIIQGDIANKTLNNKTQGLWDQLQLED
tara:strand:- start:3294 stop:4847 length:1554 start_codon:yes stop_codon:yes gene_type:complete